MGGPRKQKGLCSRAVAPVNVEVIAVVMELGGGSGGQLLKNRLSDNVGGVKHILSIPLRALGEERHFALVEWPYQPQARS